MPEAPTPTVVPGSPISRREETGMPAYVEKARRRPSAISRLLGRLSGGLSRLLRPRMTASPAGLSYRFLARQINIDLPRVSGGRTILLSSSVPPAASNEAMLMFSHALAEELGVRILLVDGTFGADGIGSALGHDDAAGLMDSLYDGAVHPFDVIQTTPRHNISLLPSGRPRGGRPMPTNANRVAEIYEQLCTRFDYVLVQQGSINADTRYLVGAAKADLIVVLVEEGVTPVDELDRCLDVFRSHQISNLRLVLCEPR